MFSLPNLYRIIQLLEFTAILPYLLELFKQMISQESLKKFYSIGFNISKIKQHNWTQNVPKAFIYHEGIRIQAKSLFGLVDSLWSH